MAPGIAGPVIAACVLLAVDVLGSWGVELACDGAAARWYGAIAPRFWEQYGQAKARRRRGLPAWRRVLRGAARLVPTHPPLRLRAWVCRSVHARTARLARVTDA